MYHADKTLATIKPKSLVLVTEAQPGPKLTRRVLLVKGRLIYLNAM